MVITFFWTLSYSEKAELLSDSLDKHWLDTDKHTSFGCLYFKERLKSYRENWPENRQGYSCPQAGEFADWWDWSENEILCNIDADTIMQRPFRREELAQIKARLKHNDILSVYGAYPPTNLLGVLKNIGRKDADLSEFPGTDWMSKPEFTASFMIARKSTFRKLRDEYLKLFDAMTKITGHHAGTQWLINYVCYKHFKVGILPPKFQCGEWYDGADMTDVIFNHTK